MTRQLPTAVDAQSRGADAREDSMQRAWMETPVGGSPEAERLEFERLAREIMRVQLKIAKTASAHGVPHGVDRAFHAKSTLAVDNAELRFLDLPADLRAGFAQPGASYPTVVRFSNASGIPQADTEPDLRGVALRVQVSPEESHDLLMTNFPVSHARDANQFVEFAKATAGGGVSRLLGILGLLRLFGLHETMRMLKNVMTARRRTVTSVATETYWSRGAMRWGPTLAVRYLLRPAPGTAPAPAPPRTTRATCRTRRLAACCKATSASSCASRGTSTTRRPRSRTPRSSGRSVSLPPSRWPCSPSRAATSARSMRWRRPGSSTRWPSTPGTPRMSSARSAT